MKRNCDPNSELMFNTTWDLSEDHNNIMDGDEMDNDTIVINLYKYLSELNIEDISKKEDKSSNETIIHNIKKNTKMILQLQYRILPS